MHASAAWLALLAVTSNANLANLKDSSGLIPWMSDREGMTGTPEGILEMRKGSKATKRKSNVLTQEEFRQGRRQCGCCEHKLHLILAFMAKGNH